MTEVMEAPVEATDRQASTTRAAAAAGSHASLLRLVRAELRWIFRRPRTLVVLGLIAVIPVIVGLALTLIDGPGPSGGGDGDGPGTLFAAGANALVLPIGVLTMALGLLLPLSVAMSGADAIAGEQSHGTLRGWLLAPVSRGKLLFVKVFGVATFALAAAALMASTAVLTGLVISGTDSLITMSGTTLSLPAALGKVAIAVGWVTVQLWAVGAVALAISATTEHPMVVVVSVLGGVIIFNVLGLLPALDWLRPFLITSSWEGLADVLRDPMPTEALADGTFRALAYLVIALSLAYAKMITKDG